VVPFDPGSQIRSVDNAARVGVVTNTPVRNLSSGTYYHIRWEDGDVDYAHEEELEPLNILNVQDPFSLVEQGRYGRVDDLRRNLTFVHLTGRLANMVYSMGVTNTDFYGHQYKPLLALLDSPISGLLIADEVGLGKTIEAGLIWTELRARFDMRRLLIVCPAMLREKWKDEMFSRFGVNARIVKIGELIDEMKKPSYAIEEGEALIVSYQTARPPKQWKSDPKKKPENISDKWKLADFMNENIDNDSLVDLVIFDEAHYMRNKGTSTTKLGELLSGISEYKVMLSATPVNLKNEDLFNLLKLLDPEHFSEKEDFKNLISANQPLLAARDAVYNKSSTAEDVIKRLVAASNEPLLTSSLQLKAILENLPTDQLLQSNEYRASLADSLERLSLLSHVLTRTRKRDVQERRVIREVKRESVLMSSQEAELYQVVTEAIQRYASDRGINDGFLLSMPQRQVTSCPAAFADALINGGVSIDEYVEDMADEYQDDNFSADNEESVKAPLKAAVRAVVRPEIDLQELRSHDTKFERLLTVVGEFLAKHPKEKIILFTTFRPTARYLVERFKQNEINSRLLWGGQKQTKQEVIDEFKASKTDSILVSTEVASEGVDLQFCKVLINYDLPWNPTRIEQRIGRIDRLGQKSEIIHIWNLFYKGTIDERVVIRLMDRLRIFEEALGEAEAVVGEQIHKLETQLLSRKLTEKEEDSYITEAARVLETQRLQREDLEKNAAHLMAHGQRVLEKIDAAKELAHRVVEQDLFIYVKDYLVKYWKGHRFLQEGDDAMLISIELPPELSTKLNEYLKANKLVGKTQLGRGVPINCRFLNKVSEPRRRGEEIVHQFHPLIRFISHDLKERNEHYYPLISLMLKGSDTLKISPSDYAFFVRSLSFSGVKEEQILAVAAVDINSGEDLHEDDADQLLQLARLSGKDWITADKILIVDDVISGLGKAEMLLEERFRKEKIKKNNENADRASFQLESIDRHVERRMPGLKSALHAHIAAGRDPLAKAAQGKINKLEATMNTRRAEIEEKAKVVPEKKFVCAGVVRVEG